MDGRLPGAEGVRRLGTAARLWRFGVVGVAATIVHVAVGMTLHHGAGASPLWANGVAFSVAVIVSYLGQTRLTFPEATAGGAAFFRFVAVALFGFGLNQLIVWIVTGPLAGPYWIALATVIATVPMVTFLSLRYWALRH